MAKAKRAKATAKDAQVPPTRQTGRESATGVALEQEEKTIPQGEDRGSKTPIEGGDPKPDVENPKAAGAQIEPARFTSNGQLPHNQIPTPSGPVPVGATGLSQEDARARIEEINQEHDDFVNRRESRKRVALETVQRLSAPDLRAIGEARGYSIPDTGGLRAMRQAFLDAQDDDKELSDRESRVKEARKGTKASRSTSR